MWKDQQLGSSPSPPSDVLGLALRTVLFNTDPEEDEEDEEEAEEKRQEVEEKRQEREEEVEDSDQQDGNDAALDALVTLLAACDEEVLAAALRSNGIR
jgi:DNA-binding transcriptional MerR regulator